MAALPETTQVLKIHNRYVVVGTRGSEAIQEMPASLGAMFAPGKGGHLKVFLNGRRSVLPMSSGDLKRGTAEAICKQLGIKE